MKLVLHPSTAAAVDQFIRQPKHALLLEGTAGAGKGTLALHVASALLNADPTVYPFFKAVVPTNSTISIDDVRSAQQFMHLKTLGQDRQIRRVLIIENAQTMTIEAQNAFLKLLEEPPLDTVIIMTTTNQSALLPTIRSRVAMLRISGPHQGDLVQYFEQQGFAHPDIQKAFLMSDGQAGLMQALLSDDTQHPLIANIQTAKKLLSASIFERLTMIDDVTKQRADIRQLLDALQLVCRTAMLQATQRDQAALVKRWHKSLKRLSQAQQTTVANPNLKLLMDNLMLNL